MVDKFPPDDISDSTGILPSDNGGTGVDWAGSTFLSAVAITGNISISANSTGLYTLVASSGYTVTLPLASSCPGKTVSVYVSSGTSGFTWTPTGSDKIHNQSGGATLFVSTSAGTPVLATVKSDGVDRWMVVPGPVSNIRTTSGGFVIWTAGGNQMASGTGTAGQIVLSGGTSVPTFSTVTAASNNVSINTAGGGLLIKEGSNATSGAATLVGGTATVSTTKVTASSRIQLTSNVDGGTPGWLRVSARSAGTSFTITSSSASDTSTVAWLIIEPS